MRLLGMLLVVGLMVLTGRGQDADIMGAGSGGDTSMTAMNGGAGMEKPKELPKMTNEGVFPVLTHKGDVLDFLKMLSVSAKQNIIPSGAVGGPIQVTLYNVTFREALDSVLSMNGYVWEQKGNFIYVYSKDEYDGMKEDAAVLPEMDDEGVFADLTYTGDIADFLKLLSMSAQRNIMPSSTVRGQVQVSLRDVTFDEALDVVLSSYHYVWEEENGFIYVYSEKEYATMQEAERKMESRIFRMNYVKPGDVVEVVKPLLSENGQMTTPKEESTNDGWAGYNYLIVKDYPENLATVEEMIVELDERPQQVLVEATILSASLTDSTELGIDFQVLGAVDFSVTDGVVGSVPEGEVGAGGTEVSGGTGFTSRVSDGGLSVGIINNNIGLFIKAIESVTDVVAIGNPKVITLNRHEGQVIVGGEQGYVTSETSVTSTTQSVQNLETGTILRFTPYIMDDGYIRMVLHPEDSTGEVVVKGNFALPEKTTAEVRTNVLVKDGHTVVIGGLFRDKTTVNRSQVPLLGNIPVLGDFFRSSSDSVSKEELIFLITPHIVSEPEYSHLSKKVLQEYDKKVLGIEERLLWFGRSRLAQAHYQQALKDQAAGKTKDALWNAVQASQMNPNMLDALRLKEDLQGRERTVVNYGWMQGFMQEIIARDRERLFRELPKADDGADGQAGDEGAEEFDVALRPELLIQ